MNTEGQMPKPKKMSRAERREKEREIAGKYAAREDVKAFFDRSHKEPHLKSVEVTAYGMRVEFQGLPIKAAERLLDVMDEIRREGSVPAEQIPL